MRAAHFLRPNNLPRIGQTLGALPLPPGLPY